MPNEPIGPSMHEQPVDRRRWLGRVGRISVGLGALAATLAGLPVIGFVLGPLLRIPPESWRSVGRVSDFVAGSTTEVVFDDPSPVAWSGRVARTAAWLRHDADIGFIAYSMNCTHLGCPVRWMAEAELFMCPCHGGVYYSNGNVAGGPPPRALTRYPVRIRRGAVEIRTTPVPIT